MEVFIGSDMRILKKIIKAGLTVKLKENGKLRFTYEGNMCDRPPTFKIIEMIKEVTMNHDIAVAEIKRIESAEMLNNILPSHIRTEIDYIEDTQGEN